MPLSTLYIENATIFRYRCRFIVCYILHDYGDIELCIQQSIYSTRMYHHHLNTKHITSDRFTSHNNFYSYSCVADFLFVHFAPLFAPGKVEKHT